MSVTCFRYGSNNGREGVATIHADRTVPEESSLPPTPTPSVGGSRKWLEPLLGTDSSL
jgi:hypothetical protein